MQKWNDGHKIWADSLLPKPDKDAPDASWSRETWHIRHSDDNKRPGMRRMGEKPRGFAYPVLVHIPPKPKGDVTEQVGKIAKAAGASSKHECDGGRWITVHPNGENEPGQAVYLCPNADGSHTIVGGAGGKLNGLRMTGVKSEEDYKKAAVEKRDERVRQNKLAQEIRQQAIGKEAFAQEQADKAATATESKANRHNAERAAIAAVFHAQGIDPSHMDVPKEALAGVDAKTAETIKARYHKKLYAYAKQVAANVRELVSAGIDGVTEAATGDLGVGDLARAVSGSGNGIGYTSPLSALAAEYGLTDEKRNEVAEGVKVRSLLDRSDLNLEEVAEKRQGAKARGEARAEAEGRVRAATAELSDEGVGPAAVAAFSKAPAIETMGQAVDVLTAMKNAENARAAHKQTLSALDSVGELSTLPKAAVVVAKPLTDDEAKDAIAGDLDEMARRKSMIGLVGASNAVEAEHGSLRESLSLGHNLAFNTICSAVDGSNMDPLVHDVLGASGAASILAARWRASLPATDFAKLKDTLANHHVQTQNAIADSAVQEAGEYLGQAETMAHNAPLPNTPEGIEAALVEQDKRTTLLEQARRTLGVARGRVEAAAALNDALMRSGDGPVQVALGAMSAEQAITSAAALGLDNPTEYDETGKVKKEGDFDIFNDGKNAILSLSPQAVQNLAGRVDPALMARQERSTAIKRGDFDEANWVPEGLTRRPTSEYEVNPLEIQRPDIRLGLLERPDGASLDDAMPLSQAEIQDKLRAYVGALLDGGRDPAHIDAVLRSEEFAGGLGVSQDTVTEFKAALQELSPPWNPTPGASANPEKARAEIERYKAWQTERESRFDACLQEHLARQKEAGVIDGAAETLGRQRLPLDATVQDCAYVATASDPRLRFAFHKPGDLDSDARASVRRFAYEHLFGLDPKKDGDALLTPLSAEQHEAWQQWNTLSDTEGDPYKAIQAHWAEASQEEDLFGDKNPPHPLSVVDMSDDTALVDVARKVPGLLGYQSTAVKGADGQPTQKYVELEASADRPANVIAQDVRARAKKVLRTHFLSEMLGMQDLASQGWSPAGVRTASDRWGEYATAMGGDTPAYKTVQEFMQGHIAEAFAKEYAKRTGMALALGETNVQKADRHAEAMLPPDVREAMQGMDASARAKYIQRERGKFAKTEGGVRDQADLQKQAGRETAALFGGGDASGDAGARNVSVSRKTIGNAAEKTLAGILPHLGMSGSGIQAASGLNFSGDKAPIQRAIRLIEANKRQGVNLGTGMGKAVTAIGAFTHLRSQGALGENGRGLFVVPSKAARQMPSEIDKFRDPSVPLTKYNGAGASPDERRAAMADPNIHVVITTPEGLREDITHAVAQHEGITPEEATARIMSPESKEADRFDLIHSAMDAAGYKFDFNLMDEAHRLLSRAGKPDAHMQRVADAVGAKSKYYVYSTADAVKNDVSEAWDVLHKIEPARYPEGSRDVFLRKYGRDTLASGLALQREMEPYLYPERADFGVTTDHVVPSEGQMQLTPEQQTAHNAVLDAYKKARIARIQGRIDLKSLQILSSSSFEGVTGTENMARVGEGLNKALATLRDAALNQVVNTMPGGVKENFVADYANTHRGEDGRAEPLVVCTDLLPSVANIAARLKKEGHRVVTLTGEGSTNASTKAQMAFQPPNGGEPAADILVMSNAGAAGLNLQRGKHLIHVDVPQTAMIDQQRNGRIRRFGQMSNTVHVRDLVTASPFDQRARKVLTEKGKLRELMTSPSSSIDDSGLAQAIEESGVRRVLAQAKRKNEKQNG